MLKTRFAIALARAGLTQAAWARNHGFYKENVHQVLAGRGTSARILREIESFTAEQLSALKRELARAAWLP